MKNSQKDNSDVKKEIENKINNISDSLLKILNKNMKQLKKKEK